MLRWNNLSTGNSSFLDSSSIKPKAEELDMKKNRGRGRQSRASKKNRCWVDDLAGEEQSLGGEEEEEEEEEE